jgi:hypothetical protein
VNASEINLAQELESLRRRVNILEAALSASNVPNKVPCDCGDLLASPRLGDELLASPGLRSQTGRTGQVEYPGNGLPQASAPGLACGRGSVDSTTSDNGFLRCTYNAWSKTENVTVFQHSTTAGAFANIRGGSEAFSLICGHGMPGIIVCGTGEIADGDDKYMNANNERMWRPIASQGIAGTQLTLFGCQVAAGAVGSTFLRKVASAVRKPVGAWTGDVWCSKNGQVWGTGQFIVAKPGMQVETVEAPEMTDGIQSPVVLRLPSHQDYEEVQAGQIRSVNFTPIGSLPTALKVLNVERDQAGQIDDALLQSIDFSNPFVTDDMPGSILVGLLTISYKSKTGEPVARAFRVLGYSLVQDAAFPNTYYYASKSLRQTLLK